MHENPGFPFLLESGEERPLTHHHEGPFPATRRTFIPTEHPGITIYRLIRRIAIGQEETFGADAEPYLSRLIEFLDQEIPRYLTTEQELKAAVDLYRLIDPDVVRGKRLKRLYRGDVQVVLTKEQYDALRRSHFSKMFAALERGGVEPTPTSPSRRSN